MSNRYIRFEGKNSDKLVVIFSCVNIPLGKFSGTGVFSQGNFDTIFVNCPNNSWFLGEVFDGIYNWKDNAEKLKSYILEQGYCLKNTIFYGGSMGGFGAALFGIYLNRDLFVTGCEVQLDVRGGNTEKYLNKTILSTTLYPSIKDMLKHYNGQCYFVSGELFIPDILSLESIVHCTNVNIITIKNQHHSIPVFLNKKYGLLNLIDLHFSNSLDKHIFKDRGDLITDSSSLEVLHRCFSEVKVGRYSMSTYYDLCSLNSTSLSATMLKYKYLGIYNRQLGEPEKAVEEFKKAIEKGLECFEVYYNLALIYKKKCIKTSLEFSLLAVKFHSYMPKGLVMLHSKNLYHLELYKEALDFSNGFYLKENDAFKKLSLAINYKLNCKNDRIE